MRKIWYILLLSIVVLSSCKDDWDNFYGEGEADERSAASKETLWEAIEQEPKYSKFKQLLEKTKLAGELHKGRILTVWLPTDDYFTEDIMALDSSDMRRFVLNHMIPLALYQTKLGSKTKPIETLAKKYVSIQGRGDYISIENIKIAKFDRVCTNGVIHEITGLLTPTKNVMEYLVECGEEYSIFRDSLFAYTDTVFNVKESYAIGVNHVGQVIYDSVFDITNTLLEEYSVDFADEENKVTLFLPSNKSIDGMLMELKDYYKLLGMDMKKADTIACFAFLMRATFLDSEESNFFGSILTPAGKVLRLDKQILSTNYEQCSNGLVYEFKTVYMPRGFLIKTVEYYMHTLFEIPEDERGYYYELSYGGTLNNNKTSDHANITDNLFFNAELNTYTGKDPSWLFLSLKAEDGEYIDLVLLQKDIYGDMKPAKLMPGKYIMEGKGFGWSAANVNIFLNDQPALTYNETSSMEFPMGDRNGLPFGFEHDLYKRMSIVDVRVSEGNDVVRIQATGTGSLANCIRIRALKFTPIPGENY